jgi:hypothetical protein
MLRNRPTSNPRPPLPSWAGLRHAAQALAVVVVVGAVAVEPASATRTAKPRVTVIGDSIAASFDYVPAATQYLGKGLDLRSDAVVCRRLVAASCTFQGKQPETALELVREQGSALGKIVVMNIGYNDWAAVYDVDRVMKALRSAGVRRVIWVTLREAGSYSPVYAQTNARIRSADKRWHASMVVADWNAYSRGRPWFRSDGLHLTSNGAVALSHYLRPFVLSGLGR